MPATDPETSFRNDARHRDLQRPGRGRSAAAMLLFPLLALWIGIGGAQAANTIHVPQDKPTIQAGINAANNGDTVLVAPGTYKENIDFMGKAITVMSSTGAATTIIDGGGAADVVVFENGEGRGSIINGFTIQNGNAGIAAGGDSSATILNNVITNNLCYGIDVEFAAPLIQGNLLSHTTISNGGGFCGNGLLLNGMPDTGTNRYAVIIGNIVEGNQSTNNDAGGGIEIWAAEGMVIEDNVIRNNATNGAGGGILSYNSDSMFIVQNLIYGNSAQTYGGGISLLLPSASLEPFIGFIANNTIVGNTVASDTDSASQVYLEGNLGPYAFVNNIVVGNNSAPAFTCGETYSYLTLTPWSSTTTMSTTQAGRHTAAPAPTSLAPTGISPPIRNLQIPLPTITALRSARRRSTRGTTAFLLCCRMSPRI